MGLIGDDRGGDLQKDAGSPAHLPPPIPSATSMDAMGEERVKIQKTLERRVGVAV
jgi:hypothetical protein